MQDNQVVILNIRLIHGSEIQGQDLRGTLGCGFQGDCMECEEAQN